MPSLPLPRLLRYLLLAVRRDPVFLLEMVRDYGDVIHFRLGSRHFLLLNDPDAIKEVLVTHSHQFVKGRAHEQAKRSWLGEGLLVSEGETHRQQRRLIQPAFKSSCLRSYGDVMIKQALRLNARWQARAGTIVDIAQEMLSVTLAIVGHTLCGTDINSDIDLINRALNELTGTFNAGIRVSLPRWFRFTMQTDRKYLRKQLDDMIYRLIDEQRKRADLPDSLLRLLLQSDLGLTREQIRDQILTMLLAGRETIAGALTWTWYLLSQHPDMEVQLHTELEDVLAGRQPTAGDLPRLCYTRMVLAESMRLYPPAWLTSRRTRHECEVAGKILPANSIVLMSQYVTHHDSRYYPDPFGFDPMRWTAKAQATRPKYAYFPFGAGPRQCVGQSFAWMEGVLLIATLAQRWQPRLVPKYPVDLAAQTSLQPKHGLLMKLEQRESV